MIGATALSRAWASLGLPRVLANRLEKLGCIINRRGDDWITEGDFTR